MRVVVTITELNIDPELVGCGRLDDVLGVEKERRASDVPLVAGKELDIRAGAVHLVGLSGMDSLLLDGLNAQSFELLIEDLAKIHNHRLVNLLPQMGTEDLDQGDLESGDLAVQEDTSKIQLDLETDVDVGSVDRG